MDSQHYEQDRFVAKKGSQFKALLLKNGLLQAKQPCTNICQILTPMICLIFTYLIQKLATDNLPNGALYTDNPYPYVFGDYTLLDQYSKVINKTDRLPQADPARNNTLQWYLYACQAPGCDANLLGTNDGSAPVLTPNVSSLLGSIVNLPSSVPLTDFAINYYQNQSDLQTKNLAFFLRSPNDRVNNDLYNNISVV